MAKVCPHCRTEYGPEQMVCPNDGARLSDPSVTAEDALVGQVLADRYRVIRMLGEGGMGRVYLAEHVRMGRLSAVKVMSPALAPTPDAIGRFNREAANASRINHPNVASIYDFGETADGVLYLAMEYVDGESLAALIRRAGPLSLAHTGGLVRQIADALHAAHHLGIVHRDLKPDNILIAKDAEGRDRVKVVDFGIAKTVQGEGQTVTTVGMSVGTPEYMSPEQLAGETLDARTDIYSLGLVTFTMLTGEQAYPPFTSKQSLVERLTARPRSLKSVRPDIDWPARLQSALDRALSPEPDDRHTKVGDFASDVVAATRAAAVDDAKTRAMTPLHVPAIVPPRNETVPPPSRKSTGAIVAAAVLAVAAVVVLVIQQSSKSTTPPADSLKKTVAADTSSARRETTQAVPSTAVPSSEMVPAPSPIPPPVVADQRATKGGTPPSAPSRDSAKPAASTPPRKEPAPVSVATAPAPAPPVITPPTASADSLPPEPSPSEVMEHVKRAREFFAVNEPAKAGPEMRFAMEKFHEFAAAHPGTPETRALRQQLSTKINELVAMCQRARESAVISPRALAFCNQIEKTATFNTQKAKGREGGVPLQGGRRQNRLPGARNSRLP